MISLFFSPCHFSFGKKLIVSATPPVGLFEIGVHNVLDRVWIGSFVSLYYEMKGGLSWMLLLLLEVLRNIDFRVAQKIMQLLIVFFYK